MARSGLIIAATGIFFCTVATAVAETPAPMPPSPLELTEFKILAGMVVAAFVIAGFLIKTTGATDDVEILKIRFASVTFAGLFFLLVLAALIYCVKPDVGGAIFEKFATGVTPLVGTVIGYLFSTRNRGQSPGSVPQTPPPNPSSDGAPAP